MPHNITPLPLPAYHIIRKTYAIKATLGTGLPIFFFIRIAPYKVWFCRRKLFPIHNKVCNRKATTPKKQQL